MNLNMNIKNVKLSMIALAIALAIALTVTLVFTCRRRQSQSQNEKGSNQVPNDADAALPAHDRAWYEGRAFIVGGVEGGGSKKFINDLQTHFPHLRHVTTLRQLRGCDFGPNDVLLLQHLWGDIQVLDVLGVVQASHCHLFVSVHDWTYLLSPPSVAAKTKATAISTAMGNAVHSAYLLRDDAIHIPAVTKALFADAACVLHPSRFTLNVFSRFFDSRNFLVTPHIDELVLNVSDGGVPRAAVPAIHKSVINVGVLHQASEYKGAELIQALQKAVPTYRGFAVAFKIVGANIAPYPDTPEGFADCCARHNIHGLTLLNKWGETYCYALTKFLNSGLPVLYNNYGAVKERMPVAGPYFKLFEAEAEFLATPTGASLRAHDGLRAFLDYIIAHAEDGKPKPNQRHVQHARTHVAVVPPFYSFVLRDDVHAADTWRQIHAYIQPYCFYGPNRRSAAARGAPCTQALTLAHAEDYARESPQLVRRQIEVAAHWGMRGFCLRLSPSRGQALFLATPFPPAAHDFKVFFSLNLLQEALTTKLVNTLLSCFKHPNYLTVHTGGPVLHVITAAGATQKHKQTPKQIKNELEFVAALQAAQAAAGGASVLFIGDFLDAPTHCPGVPTVATNDSKAVVSKAMDNHVAVTHEHDNQEIGKIMLVESWNDWEHDTAIEPSASMGHGRLKTLKLALVRGLLTKK
jgi:hypothetical protein